jgi:para-aminobenzoate synthetase/4-amino-4-deoxychorismate lyase
MGASARYFGFSFDAAAAVAVVNAACAALPAGVHRLRLALGANGMLTTASGPLQPLAEPVGVLLAPDATQSSELFLRHKTSVRERYDAAWREAESQGAFDTLFFNELGELTEGGRSNVFVKLGGKWYTPPLVCGLLRGVMRAEMLKDAEEKVITRDMLAHAQEIKVCNALRGAMTATIVRGGR